MKRFILIICVFILLIFSLCCCVAKEDKLYTEEDIVRAYSETNYTIRVWDYTQEKHSYDYTHYAVIYENDSEVAFCYLFEDASSAKDFKNKARWNPLLWAFSAISGEPTWVHTERYGNIVVQYHNGDEPIRPLRELPRSSTFVAG